MQACIWDAVDGSGDRDTALPHRDGDYRGYCWPPATEIAVLHGKRIDGQVSEPGCDCNSDAHFEVTSYGAALPISSISIGSSHKMISWCEGIIAKHQQWIIAVKSRKP